MHGIFKSSSIIALLLLTQSALAGVLPPDRVDMLYHSYDGGGVEIDGPSLLMRKSIGSNFSVTANYYVDSVTSASVDVVTQGSAYSEDRTELSAGVDFIYEDTLLTAGYTNSDEDDYDANTAYFSIKQEVFGGLTTVGLGYSRGWDDVSRNGDTTIPPFAAEVDRHNYRLDFSQILTKNMIVGASWETISDEGYLNNPYRSYRYEDGGSFSYAPEVYPNTRTSNSASIRGRYYLEYDAATYAEYRFYDDDWGIQGHTFQIGYSQTYGATDAWIVDTSYRYYSQDSADFYSDLFPFFGSQNFMGRDKELSSFDDHTFRVGVSYMFLQEQWSFLEKGSINVIYDRMMFDYDNYSDLTEGAPLGSEPLYSFSANIFQVFVSIWF